LISPVTAIQEGMVKFPSWMDEEFQKKCIQPNALDFTVDKFFEFSNSDSFVISEDGKKMRQTTEMVPNAEGYIMIPPHTSVDCMSDFFVTIQESTAAYLIIRSTFNRNGLFLTSGLYDYGFSNNIGFVLHNLGSTHAYIRPNTRVGQIVFVESETKTGAYSGDYNLNPGQHWSKIGAPQ
jgi:deoxycytidine triphosphate deaminase